MGHYKLWKLEDLKAGIDRIYQENGRFPTVSDLDNIDYLLHLDGYNTNLVG